MYGQTEIPVTHRTLSAQKQNIKDYIKHNRVWAKPKADFPSGNKHDAPRLQVRDAMPHLDNALGKMIDIFPADQFISSRQTPIKKKSSGRRRAKNRGTFVLARTPHIGLRE